MAFPTEITCSECGKTHNVAESQRKLKGIGKIDMTDPLNQRVVIECPETGRWITIAEETEYKGPDY